ncbi:hypothetical protein M1146_04675 [Patescibacteria group bacterium]|nr:hypothetical protein [Patescibacteria group bacterium]
MVFPLKQVIDFAMAKPAEVDAAYKQFFGSLPFSELKPEWEELFSEWLIFDYKTSPGMSFLIEYILKNPSNINKELLDQLEQVAKTQIYSQFEILAIHRGQWIRLEDLFTGKVYTVYENKGSETLPGKGIIPGRIAEYEQKWYSVGANSVYFPIMHTERAKTHMRKLRIKNFSPRDTVELLRSHEEYPPVLISVPTKNELEEKRKSLKIKYEKIAKKFAVILSFNDLIGEIYKEKRVNVLDFWKGLERKGLKMEMLIENSKLFQDIWNYSPHRCLNNLSPIETFIKFNKKGPK